MPGDLLGGGDSGEEASTCFFASLYLRRASTERAGDFKPFASAAMSAFASGDLDVVAFMLLPQPLNCFVRLVMDESRRRASISALVLLSAPVATSDGRMGGDELLLELLGRGASLSQSRRTLRASVECAQQTPWGALAEHAARTSSNALGRPDHDRPRPHHFVCINIPEVRATLIVLNRLPAFGQLFGCRG